MIQELKIRNFQSHKRTDLKFAPGVNVILGSTDSGKTAIIRALRWAIYNKPGGDDFRSTWGGDTSVSVVTDKGTVTRKKGNSENAYKLKVGENTQVFTAFGSTVPEPISSLLNMEDVNLQQQLDAPFLLSETPGQVAIYFNRIAGIDVIDTAQKAVQKEITFTKTKLGIKEKEIQEKEKELQRYEKLDVLEVRVEQLEQLEKTRNQTAKLKAGLSAIISRYVKVKDEIQSTKKLLAFSDKIDSTTKKIERNKQAKKEYLRLLDLSQKITKVNEALKETKEIAGYQNRVNTLLQKQAQKQQETAKINRFSLLVGKYTGISKKLQETAKILDDKQALFNEHLQVCPLCGTKIK